MDLVNVMAVMAIGSNHDVTLPELHEKNNLEDTYNIIRIDIYLGII